MKTDGQVLQDFATQSQPTPPDASSTLPVVKQTDGQVLQAFATKALSSITSLPPIAAVKGSWSSFTNAAKNIAKQENFPVSVLLGQAANESARGQSAPGNNYFGIKASGDAGTNNLATKEYGANGYYSENSNFGAYSTPEASIKSYINLIKNTPRYAPAYQQWLQDHNDLGLLANIKAAGYATSPTYVQNVSSTPEFQQNQGGTNG